MARWALPFSFTPSGAGVKTVAWVAPGATRRLAFRLFMANDPSNTAADGPVRMELRIGAADGTGGAAVTPELLDRDSPNTAGFTAKNGYSADPAGGTIVHLPQTPTGASMPFETPPGHAFEVILNDSGASAGKTAAIDIRTTAARSSPINGTIIVEEID